MLNGPAVDPTLSWIDASEVRAALAHVQRAGSARRVSSAHADEDRRQELPAIDYLRTPATVAARVQALARWVEANLRPKRWFLADEQGLPIHDAGFGEARVAELTHAMREWRPGPRPVAIDAVTFHLTGDRRLFALWVKTPVGPTVIALENPTTEALSVIREAVSNAFRGKTQP